MVEVVVLDKINGEVVVLVVSVEIGAVDMVLVVDDY